MADQTRLVQEEVAVEMVKLKAALNQEEVTISDRFRKSLINRVISVEVDCANPSFAESSPYPEFPWGKIPDKEVKLANE